MPVIFTYPPAGIAPIAYSVSPRRTRNRVGGKNSEKRSTRIPTAFATVKCPSSCSTISMTMPRMVRTQLMGLSVAGVGANPATSATRRARSQVRPVPRTRAHRPGRMAPGAISRSPSDARRDRLRRHLPGLAVCLIERLECTYRLAFQLGQRAFDDLWNLEEPQTAIEEGVYGDL